MRRQGHADAMNGKGSKPRPYDGKKFRSNWDTIRWGKKPRQKPKP
jgi:hypothetical protein